MTHRIILAGIAFCLLSPTCFAQSGQVSVTRMGNGLTLIVQEDHATDLVGVAVWVKAGSGSETAETSGVSHFIEHLVFGATNKRKPGDMDIEMESLGATLDARTSRDWARFSTTVASRYLPKALDVLADAVSGAQFREQDLGREKLIILDELAKKESDPMAVCRDLLAAEVYGEHPYSLPIEGTRDTILKMTRDRVLDHYRKHYVAGNMAIVMVGDIDPQRATSEVGKVFQGAPASPPPGQTTQKAAPVAQQVNKAISRPFKNTFLAIGFLGPPGSDYQDVCATDVLLTYLGFGYRSWLSTELKGKLELASEVQADFLTQRDPGLISMVAATTLANTTQAKGAVFAKIAGIRAEGIPQPSLDLAKRSLLGQAAFQNETCIGRATTYGFYYVVSEPQFGTKYAECVQSVTNQDVIRVAQKYLDPTHAVVLMIGPDQGGSR